MKILSPALLSLCLIGAALGQIPPKMFDAPAYQLGNGTLFDASNGVFRLPANLALSYQLPTTCSAGQITVTPTGIFFCGGIADSPSWMQIAGADGSGKIPVSGLPDLGSIPGVLVQSQFPAVINASVTGNAATSTGFARMPAPCASGSFATGVSTQGDCIGAPVPWSSLAGTPALLLGTQLGAPGGVASLDSNQQLTPSQIPSIPWTKVTASPTFPTTLSQLTNDAGFITGPQSITLAPVVSVNGQVGVVSLSIPNNTNQLTNGSGFVTAAQAVTVIQGAGVAANMHGTLNFLGPLLVAENIPNNSLDISLNAVIPTNNSQLTNGANYLTAAGVAAASPVQSVNGQTGAVVLAIPTDDVALSNGAGYITSIQAPVQSVNGQTGSVVLGIPAADSQLTNDAGYVTVTTAPVTSVNTLTGAVVLAIPTLTSQLTNDAGFLTSVAAAAAAPVQSVNGLTGAVVLSIPNNTSQLTNGAGFITALGAVSTLQNSGTAVTQRPTVNLVGPLQAIDNVAQNRTDVSLSVPVPTNNNQLTNGANFITASQAPVQSVNGSVGNVTLVIPTDDSQIGNTAGYTTLASATAAAPVKSVNGQTGAVALTIPTQTSQLTNDSGFINLAAAVAAAPVQTVNGAIGAVVIPVPTLTSQLINDSNFLSILEAVTTVQNTGTSVTPNRRILNIIPPLLAVNNEQNRSTDISLNAIIPTDDSQLTNGAGYVTSGGVGAASPVKSVNGLTGVVILSIPTDDSQLANGAGYITSAQGISSVQTAGVAVTHRGTMNFTGPLVATDNATNTSTDISLNVPIPARTSQLVNDSGFITISSAGSVSSVNGLTGAVVLPIPTKVSQLTNDSNFIIASQVPVQSVNGQTGVVSIAIPTQTSQLTNNSGFITSASELVTSVNSQTGAVVLAIPTQTSQLTNNSGFVLSSSLSSVAFSGDYLQLINKPTGTALGAASGDLTGTYPAPTVTGINGQNMAALGAGIVCNGVTGIPSLCATIAITNSLGFTPENSANKGASNGYAPLVSGKIPLTYIPPTGGITSSQVLTALGFTPENVANKGVANGYVPLNASGTINSLFLPASSALTSAQVTSALGFVPLSPAAAGVPNGLASLNNMGQVPASQLGSIPATAIASGAVSNVKFNYLANVTSDIQAQINAAGTGGAGTTSASGIIFTPPYATGSNTVSVAAMLSGNFIDAREYGLSTGRTDNEVAVQAATVAAQNTGAGLILIPAGTYPISNTIFDHDKIRIMGVGRGDNGGINTTFVTSASFPANTPMAQIGTIAGESVFGGGFSEMTFDCASASNCGGLLEAFGEEETQNKNLTFVHFSTYGYKVLGADMPSTGSSQNEGPDEGLEFLPQGTNVATTVDMILQNAQDYRGLYGMSAVNAGAGTVLTACLIVSGNSINLMGLHFEGCHDAIQTGGTGTVGVTQLMISGVTNSTGSTGPTVHIQNGGLNDPQLTLMGVNGSVLDDTAGTTGANGNFYTLGKKTGGAHPVFTIDGPIYMYSSPTYEGDLKLVTNDVNAIDIQSKTSPFRQFQMGISPSGQLLLNGAGAGASDVVLANYWASLSLETGDGTKGGLNMQGPIGEAGNNTTRAIVGSNLVWNHTTTQYEYAYNGGNDAAAVIFPNGGGVSFFGKTGLAGSSGALTQAQIDASTLLALGVDGTMKLAPGTLTGPCTIANRGKMQYVVDSAATNDNLIICSVHSGTWSWYPLF